MKTTTKNTANWTACNGEAHSNPFIDHCGCCMPFWGERPVCPTCTKVDAYHLEDTGETVERPVGLKVSDSRKTGQCPSCRKRYSLARAA